MHCLLILFLLFYGFSAEAQINTDTPDLLSNNVEEPLQERDLKTNEHSNIENQKNTEIQETIEQPTEDLSIESEDEINLETNAEQKTKSEEKTEPEIVYEVFSPHFMKSLNLCKADKEKQTINNETLYAEIIGKKENLCHLFYNGFNMYVPLNILPSIHGFNELHTLLKNSDITKYEYEPKYSYTGLLYALEACEKRVDYAGEKIIEQRNDIIESRTIYSEFVNNVCTIYLESKMSMDNNENDYTIVCRLPPKFIQSLLSFYADVLKKYGAKREFAPNGRIRIKAAEQNKETKQADDELMYYLQQKGFCIKPEL